MREKASERVSSEKLGYGRRKDSATVQKRLDNRVSHRTAAKQQRYGEGTMQRSSTVGHNRHGFDFQNSPYGKNTSNIRPGHRGVTRLPWGRGPREPPVLDVGHKNPAITTLFVDGLPQGISSEWLWDMFSQYGRVVDVYVSRKRRTTTVAPFGFVRFKVRKSAVEAMENLNGEFVKGKKMYVSMAKYEKGGHFGSKPARQEPIQPQRTVIRRPATRDTRKYVEVVRGVTHTVEQRRNSENRVQQSTRDSITATLKVNENVSVAEHLQKAVVVEVGTRYELREAAEMVDNMELPTASLSAISPNELILFFDCEEDIEDAINGDSPLRVFGDNIHRWEEKEFHKERIVWVECTGIHPKWWSYENTVKLGQLWGQVLKVEEEVHGVNSLTAARLLLKTKIKRKFDEEVRVEWGSNCGTVYVKELPSCRCMVGMGSRRSAYEDDDSDDEHERNVELVDAGGEKVDVQNQMEALGVVVRDEERAVAELGEDNRYEGGTMVVQGQEMESGSSLNQSTVNINSSVDEWLVGPLSCPIEPLEDYWFDPIATLECPLSLEAAETNARKEGGSKVSMAMVGKTPQSKRPRGRPKRSACSLPDPLSVPSTPPSCSMEALETWKTATMIDVTTHDEKEIVEELRRSKRVQVMEGSNST
ncbi:unnamed protein product [Amaranthus hypochondriacus]